MAMLSGGLALVFHGGLCCGIKTVMNLGHGKDAPSKTSSALDKIARDDRDQGGGDCSSRDRFFHEEAPSESNLDRMKRYIDYMKRRRPCNILECAIVVQYGDGTCTFYDEIYGQKTWIPVLIDLGFKEVNRHRNSNSGNVVGIFHLNIDEDYFGKARGESIDEHDDCDDEDED